MLENPTITKLESILKEIAQYEKKGFDASILKIFIKDFKNFLKISGEEIIYHADDDFNFDQKLDVIKSFLEDKKAFPTIKEIIEFGNKNLQIDFRDQKESRNTTINRIIGRIKSTPELKDALKIAVLNIRNEIVHKKRNIKSRKELINADTFIKWAEIIKNI
jgi:hypothetical protein